jgi:ABC-type Fe3+ transport system permease subunit/DNA-binding beta-propeller fold protein YncE
MSWTLLKNSLLLSGLTAALAAVFGLLGALCLCSLGAAWRIRLLAVAVLALALPPFLVTDCWLYLLGHLGVWRRWLPLSIYSLGGAVWILALQFWPIPLLAAGAAWQRLEPSQLESETRLSGTALVRWLLLPSARPALAQGAVLTFVLALNNFTVPAILQVKAFPAEVWVSFSTSFDYAATLRLSWPLVLAPLALLVWLRRREISWPRLEGGIAPRLFRRQLGRGWVWGSGLATLLLAGLAVALPLAQLAAQAQVWKSVPAALAAGQGACAMSFFLAAGTATLTVGLGLIGWRLPLGTFLWLPFLAPGILVRIGLIYALNRPPFSGLGDTVGLVLLALGIHYVAIGWNGAVLARRSVDTELTDAGVLSGASGWQLFRHVHWPQMAPQLAAAWYLTYLLCLWDVETLVLVVPPGGETLALRIFNLLHYGHNVQVHALCLLLLALALLPLLAYQAIKWLRQSARWVRRILGLGPVATAVSWLHGARFSLSPWERAGVRASSVSTFGRRASLVVSLSWLLASGCSPPSGSGAKLQSQFFSRVEVIGSRGTAPGQFIKPRSLAVDAKDNLYVVDMTGRLQKFSPTGAYLAAWQMPQTDLGKPKGMALDGAGRIIVIEPHYSRLNHYSPEGKLLLQWGRHGTNTGQLAFPRAVAVNRRGEIFVSEYGAAERIQLFSPDGARTLTSFGRLGDGPGELNRAEGLGVDRLDRLYVADSCNHRIQVFSPAGKWLRSYGRAGKAKGQLSYPYDLRVDAAGCQFVCEFGNSRVQVFSPQDQPLETLGGPGAAPGQFNNPWSLALDSAGNLYVADAGNHRVQKFLRRRAA